MTSLKEPVTHIEDHGSRWQLTLKIGDEAVSGVGIVKSAIRLGDAAVRMGGIAGLWTSPDHRLKGYGSRSMREALCLMAERGFDTSVLFGITDFYHRYGYAPVYPDVSLTLGTADLPGSCEATVRRMARADLSDVLRIYRRHSGPRTGMAVRGKGWSPRWRMPRMGEGTVRRPGRVTVIARPSGKVVAYFVSDLQADRFHVSEVGVTDAWSCLALAAALRARASGHGIGSFRVHAPPDDPFVAFCARFGTRLNVSHPHNAGSMGRIVRLVPCMRKLLPTLCRRAESARLSQRRPLRLQTDIGDCGLSLAGAHVSILDATTATGTLSVRMPILRLSQLVFGYRSAADLARDENVHIPRAAAPVLEALFPSGTPYMWWSDRF